jgi:hypothetical protein
MERTRDEATAISLLTAISSKWHQALALKPKNAHYLSRWFILFFHLDTLTLSLFGFFDLI